MDITLRLTTLRRLLVWSLVILIGAGFGAEVWDNLLKLPDPYDLVAFFSLSYEANLPTWFSSCLLCACALLLAGVARLARQQQAPYTRHWWGLAVAFLYISLDEYVRLHERMNLWFDLGGVLYFGWVLPAAMIVALFGLSYLGFLARLPGRCRRRFILAGAIYVGGALGVELPLGYWTDLAGDDNLVYGMIDLVEESLEMIGASLFLYTLVEHFGVPGGVVQIAHDTAPPPLSTRAEPAG